MHVSLHVLEEILDAMQIHELSDKTDIEVQTPAEEQAVLMVDPSPNPTNSPRQTLKLLAQIGKHSVLMLVDSGSIGTFVSDQLVKHLKI
jgi:hypothetical protein